MLFRTLTALSASLALAGCLFEDEGPYKIAFVKGGTVVDVKVYPEVVPPVSDTSAHPFFIPFLSAAERTDTAYRDAKLGTPLPDYTSAFCITAHRRYRVAYSVVDDSGRVAFQGRADFGYAGELQNAHRMTRYGIIGCLAWPLASIGGLYKTWPLHVGTYYWRVAFDFEEADAEDFAVERAFRIREWPYIQGAHYQLSR